MRLRPRMSAIRPKKIAPTAEARRVTELSREICVVESDHWVSRRATTMPITNRSYASVKKPMPEMNMIFIWNRVTLESSRASRRLAVGIGAATSLMSREYGRRSRAQATRAATARVHHVNFAGPDLRFWICPDSTARTADIEGRSRAGHRRNREPGGLRSSGFAALHAGRHQ